MYDFFSWLFVYVCYNCTILDLSALQEFVMFCIKSVSKGMFGVLIFTERLNCIPLVFLPVSTFLHWQGLDVFCPYQFCEYV